MIILCCLLLLVSWGHGDTIPPLEVINGSFELPGDTWLTGGGIPDGWTIENFQVVIGTEAGEGNIGLNHRWIGSPVDGGRSLYLINPAGAIVKQELQGTMVTGVTYTLRYEYFSYDYWNHATITASLKRGGQVLATQTFTGDDFPIRQWELRELSYTAVAEDQDMPLTVSFEISGVGDVRLDGVYVFTITPEIVVLNMKLQEYTQVVAGLPESTDREKQKKAILELGLERAVHASEAYMIEEYRTLLEDVNEVTVQPISDRPTPNLSEALLPELKTVQSNPYLEAIYTWAGDTLAGPDLTYKKATETYNPFSDFGDARAEGANMNLFFWLAAHSRSRYNADSECIVRLFRRLHAYVDAHLMHGDQYGDPTNDFFAIGPVVQAMIKAKAYYPDLLLPCDEILWDAMISKTHVFWLNEYSTHLEGPYRMGRYANRDLGVANILLPCGIYLNDQAALDAAEMLIDSQWENLYSDGAFAYIGTQNESCGYHSADTGFLTKYYHLTGDASVLELLKATQWYAALTVEPGNVSDLWTNPSWKQSYPGFGVGGESVVALTGNAYERGILDRNIAFNGASASPESAMWYRGDIQAKALPDHYAVYDRNILGPRGRFGRFSYAATLRVPNNDEPGKSTIMGAMTTEEDLESSVFPLETMLQGIMPRVFSEYDPDAVDITRRYPDWAWLTCHDESGVSMGRDWSAIQTRYQVHRYGSSSKGVEMPWEGVQMWIAVGDRLFGLLEIAPQGPQEAFEVGLLARLRYKDYITLSPGHWAIGQLELGILESNFTSLRVEETTYANAPMLDIICSTRPLGEPISDKDTTDVTNSDLFMFTPENPHYAVVELSSGGADPAGPQALVNRFDEGDLYGLSVLLGTERYTLLLNRGLSTLVVDLSTLGLNETGGWVHYPSDSQTAPTQLAQNQVSIAPEQHVVILSGMSSGEASRTGWDNFEKMIVASRADINGDGIVDIYDFMLMAQNWLECNSVACE